MPDRPPLDPDCPAPPAPEPINPGPGQTERTLAELEALLEEAKQLRTRYQPNKPSPDPRD